MFINFFHKALSGSYGNLCTFFCTNWKTIWLKVHNLSIYQTLLLTARTLHWCLDSRKHFNTTHYYQLSVVAFNFPNPEQVSWLDKNFFQDFLNCLLKFINKHLILKHYLVVRYKCCTNTLNIAFLFLCINLRTRMDLIVNGHESFENFILFLDKKLVKQTKS